MTTDLMSPDPTPAQPGPQETAASSARSAPGTSRSAVFDAIRRAGATSRAELATLTGFTAGAVTHAVRALLAEGLIVETGDVARTKGKPRVMLSLAPRAQCAVGVQLEADWAVIAVVDASGGLLARQRVRGARSAPPDAVLERIAARATALLRAAGVARRAVLGMGLVLPGTLDVERGTLVRSPSLDAWVGVGIRELLEGAVGMRVELGNDATAAAQGDLWSGAVGGSRAHGTLCMGASIGLGLVLDGGVYRGATSNAGALGALRRTAEGEDPGRTLAEIAGPAAVSAAARAAAGTDRDAAAALGLAPEHCLAIEDSNTGATSAEAAGCTVLVVENHVPVLPGERRVFRPTLAGLSAADLPALLPPS